MKSKNFTNKVLIVLLLVFSVSCTSTRTVLRSSQRDTVFVQKYVTDYQRDTFFVRTGDTLRVERRNDTVFVDKIHWEFKTQIQIKTDTIYKIQYEKIEQNTDKEVFKKKLDWKLWAVGILSIIGIIVIVIYNILKKNNFKKNKYGMVSNIGLVVSG